ncbi:transporter, hydrophobe/amphiphile efflux-1 (HAE1) family [Planctopirus limnophila DSM 3776]|uniref:Transporter, hydrophobe/amphiphile efflux-1 (HAE1) family n=1 Tax=Planctopirus limnophila (strain ATCC 43296 / DSM 3776 / IFAM 1008 / Mu 290) TaxID=521674 RepID=D5SNK7_PLAL2|nr:multidrug efflux RND transporter permease subunit [Planctopirus limnophila]ADG68121.1 transporter, hydrophobe/amphiphile efflux-1 (HAE1) family [Planctopirus limnophila DSM 3776]
MFSRFFIDRPIFASVLSIVITLAGGIAVFTLPITQYPEITPPTVEVSAIYPGANAQVVADTVASPIEQQVNGVEGMLYMTSQCANDGSYTLTVTFAPGSNLNIAQVLVQNRVDLAEPVLPDLVNRRGILVKKKSPSVLMIVNLYSPDNSRDNLYLSNYATIQLRDELSRLPGVGDITYLGRRDYSMRVWLDPDKLASLGLSSSDVVHAIEQQNVQVAAGQIGQPPAPSDQVFQFTMTTVGRLADDQQFGEIIVKTDADGRIIRLRDVARTELGALAYDQVCTLDGKPSVALSVYQLPGSNALEVAESVRKKMEQLKTRFKPGVDYSIVYDTTPFIEESVSEVFTALRDAVILVAIVVLIFLQGWRAAVIPLVAVPVAIVGTFAAMAAFGFSLNTLTLFGLVLAIGIVVDDAIVVVEAIEHHIEHGLSPREAAIRAMDEVAGPVIAVGLVLSAVFLPCVFITGIVGQFFQQFALTIAISTVISAFNSLTLSPALAVLLLKPRAHGHAPEPLPRVGIVLVAVLGAYLLGPRLLADYQFAEMPYFKYIMASLALILAVPLAGWINRLLSLFFRGFQEVFDALTAGYISIVSSLLRINLLMMFVYAGLLYATVEVFNRAPAGFIPAQDKGYLLVNVQLPDAASLDRTEATLASIHEIAKETKGIRHTVGIAGQSLLLGANAPNFGTFYFMLDDFEHRHEPGLMAKALAMQLEEKLARAIPEARINILGAPAIDGLGNAGGFRLMIEDRGDNGLTALESQSKLLIEKAQTNPIFDRVFSSFSANTPWLYIDVNRDAAKAMGVSIDDLFSAIQTHFGSLYVNDFNRFGRTWQVNVQADGDFRLSPDDIKHLKIHNSHGEVVPLAAVATTREASGPSMIIRHNLYPSSTVNLDSVQGASSGETIETMKAIADRELFENMRAEWTELAYLQQQAGNTAIYAFLLAVVLVFLVLAAQYESWALPLAVILVVPMCLLCSILGVLLTGQDVNIFTQIGFVVLVGLACKNAILIVEFARARRAAGVPRQQAVLEACQLRLRPIIMTSLAFILGVVPLMIGEGAGAEMRQALGTAVFWGMLGVTLFGIFLTPIFYEVIQWVVDWRKTKADKRSANASNSRTLDTTTVSESGLAKM